MQRLGLVAPIEENCSGNPCLNYNGENLLALKAKTPQTYGRLIMNVLYNPEEIVAHMMSPDKTRPTARPDFSPKRKQVFKGKFKDN